MQRNIITPNLHPGYVSGRYYQNTPFVSASTSSSGGIITNSISYFPFQIQKNISIDRIAIICAGTVTNGVARLAFYSNNNGLPSNLILDAGELSAATSGVKEAIISLSSTGDWYWLAGATNVAPSLSCQTSFLGSNYLFGQASPATASPSALLRQTGFTYGAFPTNAPVDNLSIVTGSVSPLFWFRVV